MSALDDFCKRNNIYIIAYGLDADKPTSAPAKGTGYWAQDTSTLYLADNDMNWVAVGGSGGATQLTDLSDVTSANTAPNLVLATPDSVAGYYSGRSLVANDIPNLSASKITSGVFPTSRGALGLDTSANASGGMLYLSGTGTWAVLPKGTDGQYLTLSSGLPAWGTVASGNTELIATISQSTATSSISVSVTGSNYRWIYIHGIAACTNSNDTIRMQFNNDTGTNYNWVRANRSGTNTSLTGQTYMDCVFASNTAQPKAGIFYINIIDPDTKNNNYITFLANSITDAGASILASGVYTVSGASLTSVKFFPKNSANIEYMYAYVYGVK